MRPRALPATLQRHRGLAWLLALLLLGAQVLAAVHGIAHAHRLIPSSIAQADATGPVANASPSGWGHDDDGGWRCRALDHSLGADLLLEAAATPCALLQPCGVAIGHPQTVTVAQGTAYAARAPPMG